MSSGPGASQDFIRRVVWSNSHIWKGANNSGCGANWVESWRGKVLIFPHIRFQVLGQIFSFSGAGGGAATRPVYCLSAWLYLERTRRIVFHCARASLSLACIQHFLSSLELLSILIFWCKDLRFSQGDGGNESLTALEMTVMSSADWAAVSSPRNRSKARGIRSVWKLGLVGVDLLDDGVRECWPGASLFCLFLERIDSHCVCCEENQFRSCFRLRSSVFRREFAEFSKA